MVSRDRAIPDTEAQQRWYQAASAAEPGLWKSLFEVGFKSATLYSAVSDLSIIELKDELKSLLARPVTAEEVFGFRVLIVAAEMYAERKRRHITLAMDYPSRRESVKHVEHASEREKVRHERTLKVPGEYPYSTERKVLDKDTQRKMLIDKLVQIIITCDMPAAKMLAASIAPERLALRMGAGKRLSTLQGKLREYKRMHKFIWAAYGIDWPKESVHLMDYLVELADTKCGPSVPQSVLSMICFLESLGAVKEQFRLGTLPALRSMVNELGLELKAGNPKPKRKANQLLITLVASWELAVMDWTMLEVDRIQYWTRLVKLWSAFRAADQSGVPPKFIAFDGSLLGGKITISKTTGAGKSVGEVWFFVSVEAAY